MAAEIQRPLRGSRISSFYPVKSLPSLSSLDSAFQLQEYISLLIRLDVHDVNAIVSLPSKGSEQDQDPKKEAEEGGEKEKEGEKGEVTVDEACWIYEQLRRLAQDLTHPLITTLQQECTRASCPEMKAGEWLYLCVAHGNDGAMEQCCAIDYILHTLDSATALLNSPRAFPSRLQIPPTSHRHFSSLARRLGRIFAHAFFHHREAFEQAEAESSLYARFLALTSQFDLVPAEFLVIPSNAVGQHSSDDGEDVERGEPRLPPNVEPYHQREQGQGHPVLLHPSPSNNQISLHPQQQQPSRKSKSPPSLGLGPAPASPGGESPRRVGRNRTDTMVYSDARDLVEDLANRFGSQEDEEPSIKTARPGEEFGRGESPVQEEPPMRIPSQEEVETAPEPAASANEMEGPREEKPSGAESVPISIPGPAGGLVEPDTTLATVLARENEFSEISEEDIEAMADALEAADSAEDEPESKEEPESVTEEPPAELLPTDSEALASEAKEDVQEAASDAAESTPSMEPEETKTFAEVVKEATEEPTAEDLAPAPAEEQKTAESEVPAATEGEAKETSSDESASAAEASTEESSPAVAEEKAKEETAAETETPSVPELESPEKKEETKKEAEAEVDAEKDENKDTLATESA